MDKLKPLYESALFVYFTLYQPKRGLFVMPQSSLKVTHWLVWAVFLM